MLPLIEVRFGFVLDVNPSVVYLSVLSVILRMKQHAKGGVL